MKWFRAISYSILVVLQVIISPLLFKWYKNEMGLEYDSVIGVAIFLGFLTIGEIILMVSFYVSAIKDKDLKDIF